VHNLIARYSTARYLEEVAERNRDLLLDEQLCFAIYSTSRSITDAYRPLLAELGLTYPQYLVMLVLWERDRRPVKEISAALDLDYGTLSPLLKRIEAAGLIGRIRDPGDERSVAVTLTEKGERLRARAEGIPATIGCAMGLSDDARHELIAVLRGVESAVKISTSNENRIN
jgi:DNA-binding MarR family transcriptional regulator